MASWDKLTSRGNVEDRRGFGPAAGGVGIVGVVAYLLFTFLSGGNVDVGTVLQGIENSQVAQVENYNAEDFAGADSYEVFTSTVLGSTNDMWSSIFSQNNLTYTPPHLVLFRGSTNSSCGGAVSYVGPHYCPEDNTIYLDETFFNELTGKLGAEGGDVAEAYVIAHEVGHHAQHELGIMDQIDQTSNEDSVKLELQADCFAGLWLHSIKDLGVYEPAEINEAVDAARSVGDDRIQQATSGQINPEQWTHGSSAERVAWLNRGYSSGSIASCDTFN
ncbi:MAG: neutral zinc metallopeptidase [Patescibacteria group bacterium]